MMYTESERQIDSINLNTNIYFLEYIFKCWKALKNLLRTWIMGLIDLYWQCLDIASYHIFAWLAPKGKSFCESFINNPLVIGKNSCSSVWSCD